MSGRALAKRRAQRKRQNQAKERRLTQATEDYRTNIQPRKDDVEDLLREYNSGDVSGVRRSEIHGQMNTILEGIATDSGGTDSAKSLRQEYGMGKEWDPDTPEYTITSGAARSESVLERRTEAGIAGSQEQLDKSLEAIGQAGETATGEFQAGEQKLSDIAGAGGEAITTAAREGGEGIAAAAGAGATAMKDAYTEGMEKAGTLLDPYISAGTSALGKQQTLLGLGEGGQAGAMAALEGTPGYQFNLQQGLKGIQAGAAARGGTLGGRALKELQSRGAGIASQTYGTTLAQLGQVAGRGQQASTTMAGIGMQGAQGIAGAEQFGAAGAMAGAEFGARGAMQGAQFGAQGQMNAAQWGAGGRAQTALSTGAAEASVYGQQASTVANLQAGVGTAAAGITMQAAGSTAQMGWEREEAALAMRMANSANSSAMFGDLLGLVGKGVAAYYTGGASLAVTGGA